MSRLSALTLALAVMLEGGVLGGTALAESGLPPCWSEAYAALHPGEAAPFKSLTEAEQWARRESAALEPVLYEKLKPGDAGDWTCLLGIVRYVPSQRLCVRLDEYVNRLLDDQDAGRSLEDREWEVIVRALHVFAAQRWKDAYPSVERLVEDSRTIPHSVQTSILAFVRCVPKPAGAAAVAKIEANAKDEQDRKLCLITRQVLSGRLADDDAWRVNNWQQVAYVARAVSQAIESDQPKAWVQLADPSLAKIAEDAERWKRLRQRWQEEGLAQVVTKWAQNLEQIPLNMETLEIQVPLPPTGAMTLRLDLYGWVLAELR